MNKYILLIVIAFIALSSCQSGRELHYFKKGKNYYRLKINESAFLTSSRYMSGYFDEAAVDRYFGEITRADSIKFLGEYDKKKDSTKVEPLDKCKNCKLVLILSTNSEAVTDQISTLAKNEELMDMIARMANKEIIDENTRLKSDLSNVDDYDNKLLTASQQFLENIDSTQVANDSSYLQQTLLSYLNYIASLEGETIVFDDFKSAKIWYRTRYSNRQ